MLGPPLLLLVTTASVIGFTPLKQTPPLKIALLVEPTPFNYISGYANRFKEMLKFLRQAGDDVEILTADKSDQPPDNFLGFPIFNNYGFSFPWYRAVTLSFDLDGTTKRICERFKPDVIHVATPGCLMFAAIAAAKAFNIPLVMSYHTHVPVYVKSYFKFFPGNKQIAFQIVYHSLKHADLVLATSPQLKDALQDIGLTKIDVWQKGINAEVCSVVRDRSAHSLVTEVLSLLQDGHHAPPTLGGMARGSASRIRRSAGGREEARVLANRSRR